MARVSALFQVSVGREPTKHVGLTQQYNQSCWFSMTDERGFNPIQHHMVVVNR